MARQYRELSEYDRMFGRGRTCKECGVTFLDRRIRGRAPKYCSDACKQRAYRKSKKAQR